MHFGVLELVLIIGLVVLVFGATLIPKLVKTYKDAKKELKNDENITGDVAKQ